MRRNQVAVVGAAETTELGVIPNMSQIQLHADAALNAIADAGLKLSDIDGFATAVETPQQMAHYLGITPTWVDGTSVGGCSFMLHVRHAAAAIEAGLCKTVLITHAESGKSMIGKQPRFTPADSLNGQFEAPFGVYGPPSMFPIPVLRFMKTHGITHEQLAMVAVVQREWAAKNPRATMKDPITVADVLNSRMIAYPFRLLQCCLVTDGGGALILTSADRAKDFPNKPVYILGTGESVETPMVSQMKTFDSSRAFKVAGPLAFKEAGITHKDVDHLMIYDAFAHLPLYGLGDLGFMPYEETGRFIADGNTPPRRQAAAQHQWRRPQLHALRHVRHVRAAGERAADARHRAGASAEREDLGLPRRRRHVRRKWHDHLYEREMNELLAPPLPVLTGRGLG
ncbi:acetyl-CoA acetyltransferase [Bradyrhizobium elkanii]